MGSPQEEFLDRFREAFNERFPYTSLGLAGK
jgi:hypothetical protein